MSPSPSAPAFRWPIDDFGQHEIRLFALDRGLELSDILSCR